MSEEPILRADLMREAARLLATLTPWTVEAWLSLAALETSEPRPTTEREAQNFAAWAVSQSAWVDWRVEAIGESIRVTPALPVAPLPEKPANILAPASPASSAPAPAPAGKMGKWLLLIGAPPEPPAESRTKDEAKNEEDASDYNFRLAAWRAGDPDPWAPFPSEDADRPNDAILRTIAPAGAARRRAADPTGVASKIVGWIDATKASVAPCADQKPEEKAEKSWSRGNRQEDGESAEDNETREARDACISLARNASPEQRRKMLDELRRLEFTCDSNKDDQVAIEAAVRNRQSVAQLKTIHESFDAIIAVTAAGDAASAAPPAFALPMGRSLSRDALNLCQNAVRLAVNLNPERAGDFVGELTARLFDAAGSRYSPADAPLAALAALAALPSAADESHRTIQDEIRMARDAAWDGVSPETQTSAASIDGADPVDFGNWPHPDPLDPIIGPNGWRHATFTNAKGETTEVPWIGETLYGAFMDRLPASLRIEVSDDENDWRPGDGALAVAAAWGVIDPWRTGPTQEAELALRVGLAKMMTRNKKGKSVTPEEAAREVAREPDFPASRILGCVLNKPKPEIRAEVAHGIWIVGEPSFRERPARRAAAGA